MAEQTPFDFVAAIDEPLIAIPIEEGDEVVVRYFSDETVADNALGSRRRHDVRHLAGAWKDLDWDAAAEELDRIRHESRPTPPIDLDV